MSLSENKWDHFIRELKSGNCCLIIGPEIKCIYNDNGKSITVLSAFSAFLKERMLAESIEHQPEEDFYYRANHYRKSKYDTDTTRFYEDIEVFGQRHLNDFPPIY